MLTLSVLTEALGTGEVQLRLRPRDMRRHLHLFHLFHLLHLIQLFDTLASTMLKQAADTANHRHQEQDHRYAYRRPNPRGDPSAVDGSRTGDGSRRAALHYGS